MFNEDLGKVKNNTIQRWTIQYRDEQYNTEMNNTIAKMKNTWKGINSRITKVEKWITELENRMVEITATGQNKETEWKEMRTV